MTVEAMRTKRLIGLFLLGYLLFNHPIISLFNLSALVWGIPLLYLYIFGGWALMILLMALIARTGTRSNDISIANQGHPTDTAKG